MRELVYLSDKKLRHFVPEGRPRRFWQALTALRINTPVGGLDLESADTPDQERQQQDHLASVVRHIEEQALWFQDLPNRAGRWVYFEAPLNILQNADDPDTIVFVDPKPGEIEGYHQPRGCRLLLHGATQHLYGAAVKVPMRDLGDYHLRFSGSFTPSFERVLSDPALSASRLPTAEAPNAPVLRQSDSLLAQAERHHERTGHRAGSDVGTAFEYLLDLLQPHNHPWAASWMRGYARVSAGICLDGPISPSRPFLSPCLIATPLYVERAHDLPDQD